MTWSEAGKLFHHFFLFRVHHTDERDGKIWLLNNHHVPYTYNLHDDMMEQNKREKWRCHDTNNIFSDLLEKKKKSLMWKFRGRFFAIFIIAACSKPFAITVETGKKNWSVEVIYWNFQFADNSLSARSKFFIIKYFFSQL